MIAINVSEEQHRKGSVGYYVWSCAHAGHIYSSPSLTQLATKLMRSGAPPDAFVVHRNGEPVLRGDNLHNVIASRKNGVRHGD